MVHRFSQSARDLRLPVKISRHLWPSPDRFPPSSQSIALGLASDDLAYLDSEEFDADIGICVLRNIQDADHILGRLLVRSNRYRLLCLWTIEELPDFADRQCAEFLRQLMVIPTDSTEMGNGLREPYGPHETKTWDIHKTPIKKKVLTLRPADDLSPAYMKGILQSVHIEKHGL